MQPHLQCQPSLVPLQPDFLTRRWFTRANVTALRPHLKYLVFKHMLEQVRFVRSPGPVCWVLKDLRGCGVVGWGGVFNVLERWVWC